MFKKFLLHTFRTIALSTVAIAVAMLINAYIVDERVKGDMIDTWSEGPTHTRYV